MTISEFKTDIKDFLDKDTYILEDYSMNNNIICSSGYSCSICPWFNKVNCGKNIKEDSLLKRIEVKLNLFKIKSLPNIKNKKLTKFNDPDYIEAMKELNIEFPCIGDEVFN